MASLEQLLSWLGKTDKTQRRWREQRECELGTLRGLLTELKRQALDAIASVETTGRQLRQAERARWAAEERVARVRSRIRHLRNELRVGHPLPVAKPRPAATRSGATRKTGTQAGPAPARDRKLPGTAPARPPNKSTPAAARPPQSAAAASGDAGRTAGELEARLSEACRRADRFERYARALELRLRELADRELASPAAAVASAIGRPSREPAD